MSDDATDADARYQERIIMADRPHVDGLTRGTVVEYDGWQWGVVTEIAQETEPTKVGFVLLDEIGDWIVRQLEDADGCAEHYQAVRTFRDGEHEYWTPAEYIQDDDMWEILGPIHPDAREGELVTDGGVDQSEAVTPQQLRWQGDNTPVDRFTAYALSVVLEDGEITADEASEALEYRRSHSELEWINSDHYPGDDAYDQADLRYGGFY